MDKIIESIISQLSYLVEELTSTSGYTTLFKGGVVLLTACAISIQQVSTMAIPLETSAYELKFKVEHSLNKKFNSIDELECKLNHESYPNCMLSKYKGSLTSSSIDALVSWLELLFWLSYLMIGLSIIGFLFHPHIHKKTTIPESSTKTET